MGLYLCIFQDAEEIDGVEVGSYADFNNLRSYILNHLEEGKLGSRFPIFMTHSDSDGEWSNDDCIKLINELNIIIEEMKNLPATPFGADWQHKVATSIGLKPENAFESFIDVDGEPVLGRIYELTLVSVEHSLPILFQ